MAAVKPFRFGISGTGRGIAHGTGAARGIEYGSLGTNEAIEKPGPDLGMAGLRRRHRPSRDRQANVVKRKEHQSLVIPRACEAFETAEEAE